MSEQKRVPHAVRAQIKKWKERGKLSVREIAKFHKISPTTAQKWLNRDSLFDQSRDPTVCPVTDIFEEVIFFEMLRLSRYHHGKLMRYLAPISSRLPSQGTPLIGRSKALHKQDSAQASKKAITSSTVLRRIKRYASGKLLAARDTKDAQSGAVAIHKIRIEWSTKKGKTEESEIVLLMDRATGLLYARAYKKVQRNEVKICTSRFAEMYGQEIQSMHFVMSSYPHFVSTDLLPSSTVLDTPRMNGNSSLLANKAKDSLSKVKVFDFPLCADDDTPYQTRRARIPGAFRDREALNRVLSRLVNKINLTQRYHRHKPLAPVDKLLKHKGMIALGGIPPSLLNKIKLPRRWSYTRVDEPTSG